MSSQRIRHVAVAAAAVMGLMAITAVPAISQAPARSISSVASPTVAAGVKLNREVFGFALASSLSDPTLGYPSWNFSLLSTVAFFGLHVNWDGTIVHDSGWNTWNSSALSGMLAAAHARGTRVVVTVILQDFAPGTPNMCAGLINRATTVRQTLLEVTGKGVDGVNVDYEGLNGTCQNGQTSRSMMTSFVSELRTALPPGSYLSVDTYASSAIDSLGFFDVKAMSQDVDAFFVMAYDLEYSNYRHSPLGCTRFCLGPTAPLTGYYYNDTTTAGQYSSLVPASKVILGVPYYGRKACVGGAVANAYPSGSVTADGYQDAAGEGGASRVQAGSYAAHRDAHDPAGQERWDTWFNTSMGCIRELYWDDATSLGAKYDLVNRTGLRGVGIWTLNYGGGAPALWAALSNHFVRCTAVAVSVTPSSAAGVGAAVSLTARADGCPSPLYRFAVMAPGTSTYQMAQDYSSSGTFAWKTSGLVPGVYRFSIWARDSNSPGAFGNTAGRWDAYNNGVTYTLTSCSGVSVAVSPASPSDVGSTVTFKASAAGCPHTEPLYHFGLMAPGATSFTTVQAYSTGSSYAWNTSGATPGTYRLSIWVKDSASGGALGNAAGRWDAYDNAATYTLRSCSAVAVAVSPASPSASGTTVTVTAHATGCTNPLYHFGIMAPGASGYSTVQDYSASGTYSWSTSGGVPGTYRFSVWTRDAASAGTFGNSAGRWDAYNNGTTYALTPVCNGVTVSVSPGSPQRTGTAVTVTAHATGCPNPVYHFGVMVPGATGYQTVQGYSTSAAFVWKTAGLPTGTYRFSVWARDASSPGLLGNTAGRWDTYDNATFYALS